MDRFLREPVPVRNAATVIVTATFVVVVAGGIAIVTVAFTSTFVTRAQREQVSGRRAEDAVDEPAIAPRLKQMSARLERVESLLLELTRR